MRILKPVRAFSLGVACIWNFFYLWSFLELFDDIYRAENGFRGGGSRIYTMSEMMLDMIYTFNFTLHGPIWMINLIIMIYEYKIDVVQQDHYSAVEVGYGKYYNYRLGWSNVLNALISVINLFNPFWWIYHIMYMGYGHEEHQLDSYYEDLPRDIQKQLQEEAPEKASW